MVHGRGRQENLLRRNKFTGASPYIGLLIHDAPLDAGN
jgi:hypothetical protein